MKTLTLLCVLLVVACGCGRISSWTLTSKNTDLKQMIGYESEGVTAGIVGTWGRSSEIEWGPEPETLGLRVTFEASWEAMLVDNRPLAPRPVNWLENIQAIPYGGLEFVDDVDNGNFGNLQPNWIVGLRYPLSSQISVVTEYIDGDQAEEEVSLGLAFSF